jgi:CRP/FNR family transcriptional regulator, anaerobic regulatory protein
MVAATHAEVHRGEELCVALVPLFQELSHDEQVEVARVARPTSLARGEQVYGAGSELSQLLVVHTGRVKISRIGPDGHEQIVRVLGPGDFVGESAFVSGRRPDHHATALEPSTLCSFRHTDLEPLVRRHPSIGLRLLQGVSRRLQEIESRLAAVISGDVSSRLASYLLSLAARPVDGGIEVELPMAKKDVASLLDTTPESLSRQLRRLHDAGVTSVGEARRLVIHDVDALMELSAQT